MKMTLGAKISAALIGTLALAIVSAVMAAVSGFHSRSVLDTVVLDGLLSLRAVAELEIALLEQSGFVSAYIMDGNRTRLDELERRGPAFTKWLDAVRDLPRTDEERLILAELESVFEEYARARGNAVQLYDAGEPGKARVLFLEKVYPLYRHAYKLCERLVASTRKRIQTVVNDARSATNQVTAVAFVCMGATVLLGFVLFLTFARGVLIPLRRMAEDVRVFRGENALISGITSPRDELRAIGTHLRALMLDVRQARSRLANSEKLASVGKLAACVAHEIRNPLTSLKMRLFAVTRSLGEDSLYGDDLEVMSEEITRLEAVITSFLEFARPPKLLLQPAHVNVLISKSLELVRHRFVEKDIGIERSGEADLPAVLADAGQMRQVLLNLLINAAEAMDEGGRLQIQSSLERGADTETVVIRISDTGEGIPLEHVDQIVEPFFTLRDEGSGLGLSIAAHIMARHGGSLRMEKTGPEGTCFSVSIPLAGKDD